MTAFILSRNLRMAGIRQSTYVKRKHSQKQMFHVHAAFRNEKKKKKKKVSHYTITQPLFLASFLRLKHHRSSGHVEGGIM